MAKNSVLFILRRRQDFSVEKHSEFGMSTGLFNSAWYMHEMMLNNGFDSKVVVLPDNNGIDREVSQFKPTHVIIEALWVVPSKFAVLTKLHPNVKWIIRLHSDIPFLANEGIAMDWIGDYLSYRNISIAVNSPKIQSELNTFAGHKLNWDMEVVSKKIIYLPNYYPQNYTKKPFENNKDWIDVSCFGAMRPMKNHLIQAIAAIQFADHIGKKLKFHINVGRVEQRGDTVLQNLKALFLHIHESGHELINHEWMPRDKFLDVCKTMDIGMQVSFSETFNIVTADMITQGIPIIGSSEIPWLDSLYQANATSSEDMAKKLISTYLDTEKNVELNQNLLYTYTNKTEKIWLNQFKK
jgi:hypothetical protein